MTAQPVRYVVNSHWHWDHWYGTEVYARAFPDVRIISQEKTRRMMMGPALEFNRPGIETQLPAYSTARDEGRGSGSGDSAGPGRARAQTPSRDRSVLPRSEEERPHTFPNLTFSDELTLYLGGREIRVLHYDRAVTPGDALIYLPKERVLITGICWSIPSRSL